MFFSRDISKIASFFPHARTQLAADLVQDDLEDYVSHLISWKAYTPEI